MRILKNIMATLRAVCPPAVALAVAVGCVAERVDDCPLCRLTFRYTFNSSGEDIIAGRVHSMEIYVFDTATELLASVVEVSADDIARGSVEIDGLPDGEYTFVAWGSGGESLSRSFAGRYMVDVEAGEHLPVSVGETSLEAFYMMLKCEVTRSDGGGRVVSADDDLDHLFHAVNRQTALTRGVSQTVDLDFICNTSTLKVTVTGLDNLPATRADDASAPSIYVVGNNGRHKWDNSIDPLAQPVRYDGRNHALYDTSMSTDIPVMRLDLERHTGEDGDPVMLYVEDAAGNNIIAPLDVLGAISSIRDTGGQPIYPTQESIDRQEEFRLAVAISPPDSYGRIGINITINGWKVMILDPEVMTR